MKSTGILGRLTGCQLAKSSEINLIVRIGSARDVAECYALHESLQLPYAKNSCGDIPEIWRALLSKGAMRLCLVTNRARKIGSQIVSFSALLFVTDEFCADARSKLFPYIGVELTRRYPSREWAILNHKQVGEANAGGGLNVIMCFEGGAYDGLSPKELLAVRDKQSEALHLALRGYHIKEFLANPIGTSALHWMLQAGARLRCDYSSYFRKDRVPKLERSQRPYLIGLTEKEALAHPGSSIGGLFIYTPPRFGFTRSQQVLLRQALVGETCEQLATSLSVSPWTVKKRWHAIYERVADVDEELLPPAIAYGARVASRGAERRRHLLNYLRQHLEELRPYAQQRQQPF
ncbi:MAG TPA: hypothetical protein VFQ78_12700 [Candidatus Udaeobacter sp.]|nr:hypothetical protein [Candidatus Udaeobacter sp.]